MSVSSPTRDDRGVAPRRGEARKRIFDEANELFRTRGYADVSMQDIADAAGVTKAALYYHYRNKEDLFAEVARRMFHQHFSGIIERTKGEGSLRGKLREIVEYVLDIHEEEVSWSIGDDVQRHLPSDMFDDLLSDVPVLEQAMQELFQRAIDAGEMRPLNTQIVSTLFLGMVASLSHGTKDPWGRRERQPGDEDAMVDIFLHGIATS